MSGAAPSLDHAPGDDDPRLARGLRGTAARHPVGLVWFGIVVFSGGPVLVADATISGVAFSFWRLWFGVVVLGIATLVHQRLSGVAFTRTGLWWSAICGVTFGFHQLAFMTAVKEASVVDVTLMNTIAPVIVGVLAVPLFGERPGLGFRLWSVVAMVGAAAVVLAGSSGSDGDPLGMALAVVNVVFYAVYFVGTKVARPHMDTVPFLFAVIVAAAVTVSAWVVLAGTEVTPIGRADLVACFAVALLPGAVGHFSVTWSLRWVPANLPPVIMLAIPVLSGALAWVFLDQAVSIGQVLAGAATLVGVLGAVRSPSAQALAAGDAAILAEET
jgi:drug/metabolite transporter (DMT)-like permease